MSTKSNPLEEKVWDIPFPTPMAQDVFAYMGRVIASGHPGGVIYAPTRTGKTRLLMISVERAQSVKGLRNNSFDSRTLAINATDRLALSEGGFWTWLLGQVGHREALSRRGPANKRHLALEYFRGLANTISSGRVVLFVDEAQHLTLVELGWFADLFNALEQAGFKLVLFLVGSYHLQKWNIELQGKAHAHIRSRFFSQEHPLRGLANLEDFRRCLHRYDADTEPFGGTETFTSHFQFSWHASGGLLADHAGALRQAFGEACERHKHFEVPMAYFALAVRNLLDRPPLKEMTLDLMRTVVLDTAFAKNYEAGQNME
jgi:hypothetical protein